MRGAGFNTGQGTVVTIASILANREAIAFVGFDMSVRAYDDAAYLRRNAVDYMFDKRPALPTNKPLVFASQARTLPTGQYNGIDNVFIWLTHSAFFTQAASSINPWCCAMMRTLLHCNWRRW